VCVRAVEAGARYSSRKASCLGVFVDECGRYGQWIPACAEYAGGKNDGGELFRMVCILLCKEHDGQLPGVPCGNRISNTACCFCIFHRPFYLLQDLAMGVLAAFSSPCIVRAASFALREAGAAQGSAFCDQVSTCCRRGRRCSDQVRAHCGRSLHNLFSCCCIYMPTKCTNSFACRGGSTRCKYEAPIVFGDFTLTCGHCTCLEGSLGGNTLAADPLAAP
jgi:hypothetical protein